MASCSRRARGLIVVALLCVLGLAAWYGRTGWADSGSFVLVLFGIPAVCTAVALWVERTSRTLLAPAVVAALALPSFLLLLAAMVSWLHRMAPGRAPRSGIPERTSGSELPG